MSKPNPILDYARPLLDEGLPEIHTDGRTDLYIRKPGAELPRRCIICNNPVNAPQSTLKLHYIDPKLRGSYTGGIMFYWLWPLLLLIRNIHERAVRQSICFTYSVCPFHRGNRGMILIVRITFLLACIAILPLSSQLDLPDGAGLLACIAIVLNVLIPWPKRLLRIDRMTATHAVLIGPVRDFLQSLRK